MVNSEEGGTPEHLTDEVQYGKREQREENRISLLARVSVVCSNQIFALFPNRQNQFIDK